jgi:hypothetical protein
MAVNFSGSLVATGSIISTTGFTGSLSGTASYALDTNLLDGKDSSTFATTGSNIFVGNQTITGSFAVSGSTTQLGNNTLIGNTILSGSISITGSLGVNANLVSIQGPLRLDPATDPGTSNLTASFLFTSASNTATGFDLYYRQSNNIVKFKWLEGGLSTGLLYGGVITYSGSTIFVSKGSGIINNLNASTGSEIAPIFKYVTWNDFTGSATYLTASQNTFIYIDDTGVVRQQPEYFNPDQYREALPLGRVTHANYTAITGAGSNVQTTYDSDAQQNEFIRIFGPIKESGLLLSAQTGSMSLSIGAGQAYNFGGFYPQDPNHPSHYISSGFPTASIARAYRSGSAIRLDNNNGAFYTTVDSTNWDDGTGVLNSMASSEWQIQRVFVNPVTGRTVVYYGQTTYTTLLNAQQSLSTDPFEEGEFTAKSLVFVGYLVIKGNTANLADTGDNSIIQSGIFRGTQGSSGGSIISTTLDSLSDVTISTPSNGQALIYDGGIWVNGNPSSASYAATASFVNGISNGTASFAVTASYLLGQSPTASHALTASSADNFLVRGTLTAQTINVQTITSSIEFNTGSTRNGSTTANTHQFTGSVSISGSLSAVGSVSGSSFNSVLISRGKGDDMGSIAIGDDNLSRNTTGYNNTAVGFNVLAFNQNGALNSGFGYNALGSNTDGSFNVAFGYGALSSNTGGGRNTAIGFNAGVGLSTPLVSGYNNIFLGSRSEGEAGNESNRTWIGNVDTTTTWLGGELLLGTRLSSGGIYRATIIGNTRISGSLITTGSIIATLGFTGSLQGTATTASFVQTAQTASYVLNAISASRAVSASQANNAATASYVNPLVQDVLVTGSVDIGGGGKLIVSAVGGDEGGEILLGKAITNNTLTGSGVTIDIWQNRLRFFEQGGDARGAFLDISTLGAGVSTNLLGTAISASYAITASYVQNAQTASFVQTAQTASYVLNAVSSSFASTASYVLNAVSSSFASTASYGNNFIVGSTLTIDQTLTEYHVVPSSIVGSNNMFNLITGSYSSAFFKYTLTKGSNARTGEVMAVWNSGSIQYTDNSTLDIGDTSTVVASAVIVSNSIQFNISTADSGWVLKSLGTFM